jgi:hypothetical protein
MQQHLLFKRQAETHKKKNLRQEAPVKVQPQQRAGGTGCE